MTLKTVPTSGRSCVTSFTVIKMNLSTLRAEGRNIPFSSEIQILRGLLIQTYCKKNVLTIVRMSIRASICLIHGEDSQKFTPLKEKFQKDACGPWRD